MRRRIDLQILADADKAGIVVALILHALGKRSQTVERAAGTRRQRRDIVSAALGDKFCRCRRVFAAGHSHVRQLLQKFGALLQCLTMRNDLADLGRLHARQGKQTVIYAQADAANNREVVLLHEVVHRIDRTCCAVFQRQNAVLAQALLDGGENLVKCCAEEHARMLEEFIAGLLRIRAFDALAGDSCCGREQLRRLLQRCFEKRRKRCFFVQQKRMLLPDSSFFPVSKTAPQSFKTAQYISLSFFYYTLCPHRNKHYHRIWRELSRTFHEIYKFSRLNPSKGPVDPPGAGFPP